MNVLAWFCLKIFHINPFFDFDWNIYGPYGSCLSNIPVKSDWKGYQQQQTCFVGPMPHLHRAFQGSWGRTDAPLSTSLLGAAGSNLHESSWGGANITSGAQRQLSLNWLSLFVIANVLLNVWPAWTCPCAVFGFCSRKPSTGKPPTKPPLGPWHGG